MSENPAELLPGCDVDLACRSRQSRNMGKAQSFFCRVDSALWKLAPRPRPLSGHHRLRAAEG